MSLIQRGEEHFSMAVFGYEEAKPNFSLPSSEDDKCSQPQITDRSENRARNTKERVKKPLSEGQLVGHWHPQEKRKYHWFLQLHHSHFENKQLRRMDKIFKSMATFIGSRAADQCRSHHQKMEKKYKTFYNIIQNLRLTHYNSLETQGLSCDMENQGVKIDIPMLTPAPLNLSTFETTSDISHVREELALDCIGFYNFFGEKEEEFLDGPFEGMSP